MKLSVNGIEVDCIIGELPHEREIMQKLIVDVVMEVADLPARTDCIDDAVDYAAVASDVRETLVAARCHLIERAARLAAERVRGRNLVQAVTVRVTKSGAVPGIASATAEYSL